MRSSRAMSPRTTYSIDDELGENISGASHLVQAQINSQMRLEKKISQITQQAKQDYERKRELEERDKEMERRNAQKQAQREEERRIKAEQSLLREQQHQTRVATAALIDEVEREVARAKVASTENRLAAIESEDKAKQAAEKERIAHAAERRAAAYVQARAQEELRRNQLQSKLDNADELLKQKEELRQLELQIKAEEDFLREQQRQKVKSRNEAAHSAKVMGYETKMSEKERALRQREREAAHLRHLRHEEARHRADYIAMHAKQAAEREEANREVIRARLEDKAARADALARKRRALEDQMARARQRMFAEMSSIRQSLEKLRLSGADFVLPPEVLRSLEMLGGGQHLVSMRTATKGNSHDDMDMGRRSRDHHSDYSPRPQSSYSQGPHNVKNKNKRVRPMSASMILANSSNTVGDPESVDMQVRHYTTAGLTAQTTARRRELELRRVLNEEMVKEAQRQALMAKGGMDERERTRLLRIFGMEREQAKQHILTMTSSVGIGIPCV